MVVKKIEKLATEKSDAIEAKLSNLFIKKGLETPVFEFSLDKLILKFDSKVDVSHCAIDGLPISPTDASIGLLEFAVEKRFIDGNTHSFSAQLQYGNKTFDFKEEFSYEFVGFLDHLNDIELKGWVYHPAFPESPVSLDLFVDDQFIASYSADELRLDVFGGGHSSKNCGFTIPLEGSKVSGQSKKIRLVISDSDFAVFGEHLVNLNVASYCDLKFRPEQQASTDLLNKIILPGFKSASRHAVPFVPPKGSAQISPAGIKKSGSPVFDICIPVYRGFEETITCIQSVIDSQDQLQFRIVVINDASPEDELTEHLREWSKNGAFTYLENEENLGFVGTVNRAMKLNPYADVVLLNADTVVPKGWLDRMYSAAYSARDIATVSAMSNNASICSIPSIPGSSELPFGSDLVTLDTICADVNKNVIVDLPTAHGFCMYIKRDALNDVGLFDDETYGRGYGEENDFSLRAEARGWRNVAAGNVFVQHVGSVSFGVNSEEYILENLKEIANNYPDYHQRVMNFINSDPLFAARNNVQVKFWNTDNSVLFVSLAIGGGVDTHVEQLAESFAAGGKEVFIFSPTDREEAHYKYQIRRWGTDEALRYPDREDTISAIASDFYRLNPSFVHVHHVLDQDCQIADIVKNLGIPYLVTLHDFFFVCPRITLLDDGGNFCHIPRADKCDFCIRRAGPHDGIDPTLRPLAYNVSEWRGKWQAFLTGADKVIAPSNSTAELYARVYPDLPISVVPHDGPEVPKFETEQASPDGPINVAIIGAIGPHKGYAKLVELSRFCERWADDVHLNVIGYTLDDEHLKRFANISVSGPYEPEELDGLLTSTGCNVALFLSPWPETYSYTLSEAWKAGLVPVSVDMGALGERIRNAGVGELVSVNASPPEIVEAIRKAALVHISGNAFSQGEYIAAQPENDSEPQKTYSSLKLITNSVGFYSDFWIAKKSEWLLFSPRNVAAIKLDTWIPENFRGQFVEMEIDSKVIGRKMLAAGELTEIIFTAPADISNVFNLKIMFDFDCTLGENDVRKASAVLVKMSIKMTDESEFVTVIEKA